MPAACRPASRRRVHPKPWRRGANFTPPRVRRLSAPALRAWCGFVHAARRLRLLTPGRRDVAVQLLQRVGWRGQERVALAALAAAADISIDTVGRALDDLTALKLIRRHHLLRRGQDGRTVQDVTFFELLPPPESDPQTAGERVPDGLKLVFAAWKQAKRGAASVRGVAQRLLKQEPGPSGGDDQWARWNAARLLRELGAPIPAGWGVETG